MATDIFCFTSRARDSYSVNVDPLFGFPDASRAARRFVQGWPRLVRFPKSFWRASQAGACGVGPNGSQMPIGQKPVVQPLKSNQNGCGSKNRNSTMGCPGKWKHGCHNLRFVLRSFNSEPHPNGIPLNGFEPRPTSPRPRPAELWAHHRGRAPPLEGSLTQSSRCWKTPHEHGRGPDLRAMCVRVDSSPLLASEDPMEDPDPPLDTPEGWVSKPGGFEGQK